MVIGPSDEVLKEELISAPGGADPAAQESEERRAWGQDFFEFMFGKD